MVLYESPLPFSREACQRVWLGCICRMWRDRGRCSAGNRLPPTWNVYGSNSTWHGFQGRQHTPQIRNWTFQRHAVSVFDVSFRFYKTGYSSHTATTRQRNEKFFACEIVSWGIWKLGVGSNFHLFFVRFYGFPKWKLHRLRSQRAFWKMPLSEFSQRPQLKRQGRFLTRQLLAAGYGSHFCFLWKLTWDNLKEWLF